MWQVNRAYQIADSYMLNEINFKPNDTVVDIGANVGDLYLFFKLLDTKISYIGIEPGENEFFCLNNNIDGSCINAAVSDKNGVQNFFINEDGADSSLIEPLIYTETREIKTITLDSMNFQQKIKLIKIEAEGNEPEILRGAIETLKISEYVSADLGPERGVLQESTYEEFIKLTFKMVDLGKINPERLIVLLKINLMSNRISIVTSVFNRANYIKRLYKSLCDQEFKDFEWIIGNDGSNDNIEEVIKGIIEDASFKIKFISGSIRCGKSKIDNKMISEASGDFIIFCDSDDWLEKNTLSRMLNEFEKNYDRNLAGVIGLAADNLNYNKSKFPDSLSKDKYKLVEIFFEHRFQMIVHL